MGQALFSIGAFSAMCLFLAFAGWIIEQASPAWDEIQAGIQPERRKRVTTVPARTDASNRGGEPIESYRFD